MHRGGGRSFTPLTWSTFCVTILPRLHWQILDLHKSTKCEGTIVCVCACVHACVHACVRACVHACVRASIVHVIKMLC